MLLPPSYITYNKRYVAPILDGSIDAPPSFKPAKKYSDLSGLPVSQLQHVQ